MTKDTTPTSGAAIQRYKIGYHSDEWGQRSSTPSGIPDASGSWVRYADHVTALAAGQATAAQQGAVDGFFLLLPQRPKPEAPAGTAGLDWDAYSGAQMLAFGRDSSDAAIAALRTEQPAPATQPAAQGLELANCKGDKWLTVVYRDIQPGDESRTIGEHPKVSALSWSHALHDRDAALAAQAKKEGKKK